MSALMRVLATAIAVATYVVMGGFFTQNGVILSAAAAHFHVTVAETAPIFSYLTGGNLIGLVACMVAFNVLSIRQVLSAAYAVLVIGVAVLFAAQNLALGEAAIMLCGFGAGVGLSAGAVILAKLYSERARAIAFIATDCSFSLSGYVFPTFAATSIARGWPWQSGYASVAVVAIVALAASFATKLPESRTGATAAKTVGAEPVPRRSRIGIAAFAVALALYLCGQGAFLTWAPQWLTSAFGLSGLDASALIGDYWRASLFGLIFAALVVSRIAPRWVVLGAGVCAVASLTACVVARDAHAFFLAATLFGFTSTSLFKLMISLGSEQLASAPAQLVTFMLLAASVGGTIAPALSALFVAGSSAHAGIVMATICYSGTLLAAILGVFAGYRRPAPVREMPQAA
jgi:TsgA-like MFS transporter